jgi:predicted kinase
VSDYMIIRGPLGVGKTTVSERLARALGAQRISIDELLDELGSMTWEAGYISQRTFRAANRLATDRGVRSLRAGTPVIFDGNFYWKSQIEDLIRRLPFPHEVFTLRAPLTVCLERDRTRANPLGGKSTREVYRKSTEFAYGTVIDADRPLESIVAEILARRTSQGGQASKGVRRDRRASRRLGRTPLRHGADGRRSVPRGHRSPRAG